MKKLLIPVVVLLVCAFIITACSTTTQTTTPSTSVPAATTPTTTTPATTVPTTTTPATTKPATTTPSTTTPPASTPTSNKYGGVLREAIYSGPTGSFGAPWENSLSPISTLVVGAEALLKEQVDGSLTPNLATSYDINNDPNNSSITFTLRKGVKFSDGTDFNAQAAKFNLDQWKSSNMAIGSTQYWKSVDVVDDYTVRINLTSWQNPMLRIFGDAQGIMVSPTAFQKNGIEWLRYHFVTTGPFIQKDFQRDVSMTLTKNPNYWDTGKPYLDGITQVYVADDLTRAALLKSGGADMMDCNNNNRLASDLKASGFIIKPQPASGYFSLVPDSLNADSPWSNYKVRLAAEYAIDKESIFKTLGFGYDSPAYQYYPEGSPAYDPTIVPHKYDVAKAKQLMTEAGYPSGFKTTMVVATNSPRDVALAMQAQLAVIGIQVELQYPQQAAWIQQVTGTWKNGVQFMTQSLWPNPNANWNLFVSEPPNWFKSLKHPDGWKDMLKASFNTKTPDPTLMKKLERALYDDETFIPISYHLGTFAFSDKVQDSGYGTRGMWTWWNPETTWLSK